MQTLYSCAHDGSPTLDYELYAVALNGFCGRSSGFGWFLSLSLYVGLSVYLPLSLSFCTPRSFYSSLPSSEGVCAGYVRRYRSRCLCSNKTRSPTIPCERFNAILSKIVDWMHSVRWKLNHNLLMERCHWTHFISYPIRIDWEQGAREARPGIAAVGVSQQPAHSIDRSPLWQWWSCYEHCVEWKSDGFSPNACWRWWRRRCACVLVVSRVFLLCRSPPLWLLVIP